MSNTNSRPPGRSPARAASTARDATLEATTLLALVDGLMTQLPIGHVDRSTALSTLDHNLDRVFGSPGDQQ